MPTDKPRWLMYCLLCPDAMSTFPFFDLVEIQEHAMLDHGYTQEDIRNAKRTPDIGEAVAHYTWTLPDGCIWMEARREQK